MCQQAKTDIDAEIEFTLTKIQQNFSNFSSWYYRSSLFTEANNSAKTKFEDQWEKEYSLVENAIFTDPSDQSAWFYHRWLANINFGKNLVQSSSAKNSRQILVNKIIIDRINSLVYVTLNKALSKLPCDLVAFEPSNIDTFFPVGDGLSSTWSAGFKSLHAIKLVGDKEEILVPDLISGVYIWNRLLGESSRSFSLKEKNVNELNCLQEMEPDSKCKEILY